MKRRSVLAVAAVFAALICGALSAPALATARIVDAILIDGKAEMLHSEPLSTSLAGYAALQRYFATDGQPGRCTALWHGYRATWEIREDEFYLNKVELDACSNTPRELPLTRLFPEATGPVKAAWYSGTLTVPQGRVLEYVHLGYESVYERYLFVRVEQGKAFLHAVYPDTGSYFYADPRRQRPRGKHSRYPRKGRRRLP